MAASERPRFADVRGTPVPVPGRLGMRDLTYAAVAEAYRATSILFLVSGLAAGFVYVFGRGDFEHPSVVLGITALAFVLGSVFSLITWRWLEPALDYAPELVGFALLVAGVGVSVGVYGAGPGKFMTTTVVYLQPLIFVTIGSSAAFVLGRLADSATTSARAEYEARSRLAGRRRQFLSQPVADAITADSSELLAPHRRPIAAFFCDLRGFTSFSANVNFAARLSDQAARGQILLDGRAATQLGETEAIRPDGDRVLKGMSHPIAVFEALR